MTVLATLPRRMIPATPLDVRLDFARDYLRALLADGWEWPDAHAKAATYFELDGAELTTHYDNAN